MTKKNIDDKAVVEINGVEIPIQPDSLEYETADGSMLKGDPRDPLYTIGLPNRSAFQSKLPHSSLNLPQGSMWLDRARRFHLVLHYAANQKMVDEMLANLPHQPTTIRDGNMPIARIKNAKVINADHFTGIVEIIGDPIYIRPDSFPPNSRVNPQKKGKVIDNVK